MLLKIYDSSGIGQPLVDIKDGHIQHNEDGQDNLYFKLPVGHPTYRIIQEETKIEYGGNEWLVKKIQDDAIECEIDFDFLKETIKKNYSYSNQLLTRVLTENLPVGWTVIGAGACTLHRGKTYEYCTPYDVIQDCVKKYDVRFVWKTLEKTLTVYVPNNISPAGVYLSDQLNLKSLTFQGSSAAFATRLYAYGKDGLTFAAINGGKEYIEDRSYKAKTICAYWVDNRYESAESLLADAYEKLTAMAKPERSYECKVRDIEKESAEYSHLALKMHDKVTLMVSERNIRVVYSIVQYDEYPDSPDNNTVTLSCVPETIQSYAQALVDAKVEDAVVVAEQALEKATANETEIETIEESLGTVEETVGEVSERAEDAFNRAEGAMLEAETAEMNVKDVIKGLAVPDDAYYCGDNSPTYGRTYENATEVMMDGIIYIPTTAHAEHFTEIEEHGEIECGTPVSRTTPENTHDAGSPESSRTGATEIYAGTPSQRLQMFGGDFYFYSGKAYIWQNGGWEILCDVTVNGQYAAGNADGALWLCTTTHTSDGVEYQKDTVYRWTVKTGSTGGVWTAVANKTDGYVYKSLNSLHDSIVSITAELTEQSSNIELLTAWKTSATQAIAALEITSSANSANISTLLTFMGDAEHGAVKAIAGLEATANAHEASINTLVAWMGDTDSGAIKSIADVTQKANANEASIGLITTWIGDSTTGAVKAIADVTAEAGANSAAIESLTTWKNGAAESISQLQQTSTSQGAALELLTERVSDTEEDIAAVNLKADDNAASITALTQTVGQNSTNIATLTQTSTEHGAEITTLTERIGEDETEIAQVRQVSGENGASITAIVTKDRKALALSRSKFVVGAKAPTYGYTYQLACGIMETGTQYVPSATHSENYISSETETVHSADAPSSDRTGATILESGFENRYLATTMDCKSPTYRAQAGGNSIQYELGYCYRWNGTGWVKTKTVSLYGEETTGTADELWYCQSDIKETDATSGVERTIYSAGTLYQWIDGDWVWIADICSNYAQMAAATIEVQVNTITARVTSAEGSIAALQLRATEDEATITAIAEWKSSVASDVANIASISAKANANEAEILLKADKTSAMSRVDVYYALSTSNTTAPTTGWSTTAPVWESGKYMWQKTVSTQASGTTAESAATCISGAKGSDGTSVTILGSYDTLAELQAAHPTGNTGDSYLVAGHLYVWDTTITAWKDVGLIQGPAGDTGTGISSIKEQYYLSTSNTTQTGGEWVDTCPEWVSGKYIWTRSYIEWTDETTSTTTPTLAQALNSFGASIKVNTDNIELKVSAGSIISTINQSAEEVTISAAKINLVGLITAINAAGNTTTIDGGKITTGTITATQIDATNLHVSSANIDGTITASAILIKNSSDYELLNASGTTVTIGSFTVGRNYSASYIYSGKTAINKPEESGVYIGTNGISVGGSSDGAGGYYNVTLSSAGKLTANNAEITGKIIATSGTIENLTITGKLYFGTYTSYYISPNTNNADYFINLPQFKVDADTATFSGTLSAPSGTIGGFTIASGKLYKNQTTYDGSAEGDTAGVYLGTDGIGLGIGKFYVTRAGALHSETANITGTVYAKAGTIENMTITGKLYFGNNSQYYIDANYENATYYIKLKNLTVDETNATFSGNLRAPTGSIGGFTIAASKLYKTKTAYNDSNAGVYVGTDGIGLGAGNFYVTSAGALHSTSGTIGGFSITSTKLYSTQTSYSGGTAGVYIGTDGIGLGAGAFYVTSAGALVCSNISATGGTIQNLTISGKLFFGGNTDYYLNANYNNSSWYIYTPKFRVDLTQAIFSGTLSAPSGTIGGFTISDGKLYKTQTSYSGGTAGVYIGTDGIGLGAGKFYVTSAGVLHATDATLSGVFSNIGTGYGTKIKGGTISFYNGASVIGRLQSGTNYIPWNHNSGTVNGLSCSSLLCADGGIRACGLQLSTGYGTYVSGMLALTMGQIKVQTNTNVTRYLLIYNGLIVGISASKINGYYDYSASTYDGS